MKQLKEAVIAFVLDTINESSAKRKALVKARLQAAGQGKKPKYPGPIGNHPAFRTSDIPGKGTTELKPSKRKPHNKLGGTSNDPKDFRAKRHGKKKRGDTSGEGKDNRGFPKAGKFLAMQLKRDGVKDQD